MKTNFFVGLIIEKNEDFKWISQHWGSPYLKYFSEKIPCGITVLGAKNLLYI